MSTVAAASAPPIRWRAAFGTRPSLFVCCMVVWTLTNLDQSLFAYAIPGILEEFHQPLSVAGLILTVAFVFAPVIIVLGGMAADRYGRDTMLWFLLASSALFVGLQGVATGIVSLTIFRALGFGLSGSLSPITNAITIDNAAPRLRGVAMGVLQCGYPIGWFIASMIVAPVLSHYSWRVACFAAFAMIPVALVIAVVVRRRPSLAPPVATPARGAPDAPRTAALRRLFAPDLRWHTLASFVMFLTFGGAYAGSAFFFPTYFVQARHYSPSVAASIVGVSNFVAIVGYLSAAWVGEFLLTRRTVFSLWCLGGALALAGLLWASTGMVSDIIWYSLMAILFFGTQAVVATFIGEVFPAEIRTTALAFCGSAPLTLGFAIFPSVVPAVIGAVGWAWGLTLVVIPLLLVSAGVAQLLPNVRSGHDAQ
jgi:MFS family permease